MTTKENNKKRKLNPKQELFCQLYASDREFFANGVQTYIEVYKPDMTKKGAYKSAQASASRLLSNVIICERINELLEMRGLNDAFVDKQLEFLITQHADFKSKISAIKEYNELRHRIRKKIELSGEDGKPLTISLIEFVGDDDGSSDS